MSDKPEKKKVVVIGGGAAGVFSAYLLNQEAGDYFDIPLLEKDAKIGGNTRGETFTYKGEKIHIDYGAQFFSETSEPDYCDLLREEGFFDMEGLFNEDGAGGCG